MKTINETFTDEEMKILKERKGEKNWHDYIMQIEKKDEEVNKNEYTRNEPTDKIY